MGYKAKIGLGDLRWIREVVEWLHGEYNLMGKQMGGTGVFKTLKLLEMSVTEDKVMRYMEDMK